MKFLMQLNNKSQNANDKRLNLDNFGEEVLILSLLEVESKIEAPYTQMNSEERRGSPDTTHRDRATVYEKPCTEPKRKRTGYLTAVVRKLAKYLET